MEREATQREGILEMKQLCMLVGTKDTNITSRIQVMEKRPQALKIQ